MEVEEKSALCENKGMLCTKPGVKSVQVYIKVTTPYRDHSFDECLYRISFANRCNLS